MNTKRYTLTAAILLALIFMSSCLPGPPVQEPDDPPISYATLRNGILDGQDMLIIRYQDTTGKIRETQGYLRSSGNTETVLIYTFNAKVHEYSNEEISIRNLKKVSRARK
jgi:hypothetical protein